MTLQSVYLNYTEKTSKDFLRLAEGSRARAIEDRNNRFYAVVKERTTQEVIEVQ